jgi:hypothetical protein
MGDADVESQPIGEGLSGFLEHMAIGRVAAATLAEQQEATVVLDVGASPGGAGEKHASSASVKAHQRHLPGRRFR